MEISVAWSRKLALVLFLIIASLAYIRAQDTSFVGPEPRMSMADIGLRYYAIKWSEAQWSELRGRQLELAFLIDDIGEPFLRAVRGTENSAIIDSLVEVTSRFTYFAPATRNGSRIESAYYLSVPFPDLSLSQARGGTTIYYPPTTVDRELLESDRYQLAPLSAFLELGLHANNHWGKIGDYLKPGGGMDMYFAFHLKNRWGFGGMLGVEFNAKDKLFSIDPYPNRTIDGAGGTYIGPLVEYTLRKTKQRDLALRGEVGIGSIFVASKVDAPNDDGFVEYEGLHLGLHLNYNLKFGQYGTTVSATDKETTGIYHGLNLYGGLRMRRYRYDQANGIYAFIGVGYRLGMNQLRRVAG